MFGKRLALGALVASLAVAAFGELSNSSGQPAQTEDEPGLSYGGLRFSESVWVRLDPTRSVIRALELPWAVNGKRCSSGKGYSSTLLTGSEYDQPVSLGRGGTFRKTVVDAYSFDGIRAKETQTVKGTVRPARVEGTIEGKVRLIRPNGQVVRCTFGPQHWSAVD